MSKSNIGVVYAHSRGYRIKNGEMISPSGATLKGSLTNAGYRRINLRVPGSHRGNSYRVMFHRLAAYQKFGEKIFDAELEVRHLDGDPQNNNYHNISIGTHSENMMDRRRSDRVRHAKNAARKLRSVSQEDAELIRKNSKSGKWTYSQIMDKYGIAKSTVSGIVNEKFYK